jgi:hypothetical protein
MTRIVIHAGFHKTGTTSVQNTLRLNAKILKPSLRTYLRRDMLALCEAARAASQTPDDLNMGLLRYEAASLAEDWTQEDRPILLASEDLAGHMPGRRGLKSYDRAPAVLKAMTEGFEAVADAPEIILIFTTRAAEPWLASCYAQHLKATRMTMDEGQYIAKFKGSAQLGLIVDMVRQSLTYPVHATALEDCTGALGPLDPVLALTGIGPVQRQSLTPTERANTRPSRAKLDRLLQLNRSDLSPAELKVAKRAA